MSSDQPIIVKRVSRRAGAHHGGSWKIAFADFAIAMMAFFLVMWLVTVATPEQLKMVSAYFKDPINFDGGSPHPIDLGGSPTPAPQRTLNEENLIEIEPLDADQPMDMASPVEEQQRPDVIELRELDLLLQELQNKIDTEPVLQRFREQILMEFTMEGLRIQIVDAENRPMFASGSPDLQPYFEDILLALSDTIAKSPKKISISGHTDAMPYVGRRDYGNWELSTQRANAARRTLEAAGYPPQQVARVVGYADSALFDEANPLNPINRRIDIVVMNRRAEQALQRDTGARTVADEVKPQAAEEVPREPPEMQPEAAPVEQPQPRNLFDAEGALRQLNTP
ncbi:flagellar motor protein MotB [Halopseudomonas pertucinogena]|uniref:Flagellar motor protein MotB n=1 Tax=Halopseudomonas pertucinogena TaxID=86175 RepID=A0ABQ2CPL0_9GAMM|nr:flagellar motor protein MotB [Halopseudomonas pertucinogena]GGI99871.1 flagellar motor protein MotB [Halopseudomonas pertucinogena]